MLRAEGVGGHTSSPCTLTFHCHAATRCLARDLAVPSTRDVSVVSNLCHGTSSSVLPQAATCNHCCALQCGSISSKVSGSSSRMSTWANSHQARLPLEASICSVAGSPCLPPSHRTMWHMGVCGVWKSSPSSLSSREACTIPPPLSG